MRILIMGPVRVQTPAEAYIRTLKGKRQRAFGLTYLDSRKISLRSTPEFRLKAKNYFYRVARGQEIADEIDRLLEGG